MHDPLPIHPFSRRLQGSVQLPGSKSITNRALVLAALAEGETVLEGALFSRDTELMLAALETLGFTCRAERAAARIRIVGQGGRIPVDRARLEVGNAGTVARFLTAMLALNPSGEYTLDGDAAMRARPMSGLTDALEAAGAARFEFRAEAGHVPFVMRTQGYGAATVEVDASASSQILSALLLAAPAGGHAVTLRCPQVRPAYVAITLRMREAFGAPTLAADDSGAYALTPVRYRPPQDGSYAVEPDLSAASYFLALTLICGGQLTLPNLSAEPLQGDARFAEVMALHGLEIEAVANGWQLQGPPDRDRFEQDRSIDFNPFSDTFLTYAAIAPLLRGAVELTGIAHTRKQETDRIAGAARELAELGQMVAEADDALTIRPNLQELRARAYNARKAGKLLEIRTYEDHRFAMSFGILGSFDLLGDGTPWLAIQDPACCGKTFPDFFDVLNRLRLQV